MMYVMLSMGDVVIVSLLGVEIIGTTFLIGISDVDIEDDDMGGKPMGKNSDGNP